MEQLPIFRLDICPLPGELVPLHIFEERYQALVKYCLSSQKNNLFGIGSHEKANTIGSLMRVDEVLEQFPDGRSLITCVTVGRYQLIDDDTLHPGGFPLAVIKEIADQKAAIPDSLRAECKSLFDELVEARAIPLVVANEESPLTAFIMGIVSGLETAERKLLLSKTSERERLETLIGLLSFELAMQAENISGDALEQ